MLRRLIPHRLPLALSTGALLSACGVAPLDAQWSDSSRPAQSLRGSVVLVVCESDEQVVKQMCQDRVAAELRAYGANTALLPNKGDATASRVADEARAVGAQAIFTTRVSPDYPRYGSSSGVQVGVGFGGGFGGRGFGGVGVSAPIGGSRIAQSYVANASLTDAASGRLLWTGKASSYDSSDLNWQIDTLTKAVTGGAQQAGYF